MFCTNCGAKLADGAKFCSECGTPVEHVQVAGAASQARVTADQTSTVKPTTPDHTEKQVASIFDWSDVAPETKKRYVPEMESPWETHQYNDLGSKTQLSSREVKPVDHSLSFRDFMDSTEREETSRADNRTIEERVSQDSAGSLGGRSRTQNFIEMMREERRQAEQDRGHRAPSYEQHFDYEERNIPEEPLTHSDGVSVLRMDQLSVEPEPVQSFVTRPTVEETEARIAREQAPAQPAREERAAAPAYEAPKAEPASAPEDLYYSGSEIDYDSLERSHVRTPRAERTAEEMTHQAAEAAPVAEAPAEPAAAPAVEPAAPAAPTAEPAAAPAAEPAAAAATAATTAAAPAETAESVALEEANSKIDELQRQLEALLAKSEQPAEEAPKAEEAPAEGPAAEEPASEPSYEDLYLNEEPSEEVSEEPVDTSYEDDFLFGEEEKKDEAYEQTFDDASEDMNDDDFLDELEPVKEETPAEEPAEEPSFDDLDDFLEQFTSDDASDADADSDIFFNDETMNPEKELDEDALPHIVEVDEEDALSIDSLEKELFGEDYDNQELDPTKKIDKFYTLYRKNEEFQKLLEEEYEKLHNGSADYTLMDNVLGEYGDGENAPEEEEDEPLDLDQLVNAEVAERNVEQREAVASVAEKYQPSPEDTEAVRKEEEEAATVTTNTVSIPQLVDEEPLSKKEKRKAKKAAKAAAAEEDEDDDEPIRGGRVLTALAIVVAVLLVLLLIVILLLNFMPDSAVSQYLSEMIGNFTNFTGIGGAAG